MKHVTSRIQAYLGGELDPDEKAVVEDHFQTCAECRAAAGRARRMWDLIGAAEPAATVGGGVWPSVRARTFGRETSEREWFFGAGRLARTGLATVSVAAGLMLGILLPGGAERQTDSGLVDSSWLVESTWLSESSWLGGDSAVGLDEILLGADLLEEGNGS